MISITIENELGVEEPLKEIFYRKIANTLMIPLRLARKTMSFYLEHDESLREAYKSNIAMKIHDYVRNPPDKDMSAYEHRNRVAEEILEIIFS